MLFLIAVLAVMSAAFLLHLVIRRQTRLLPEPSPTKDLDRTDLRPLFEPTAAELERSAKEDEAREIALRACHASAESAARIDEVLSAWRSARDRRTVIDLLKVVSEGGRPGDLLRAATEIAEFNASCRIAGLSSGEVAALLDSHIRLVPANERGSAQYLWLKEEVARLWAE